MATPGASVRVGVSVDSASLKRAEAQIRGTLSAINSFGRSGLHSRQFTQPLGKITAAADDFTKSLEASNARVLAFGASAGAIYAVSEAMKSLVRNTIEVEKQLKDINVILGASSGNLQKFGSELFKIAGQTGTSFRAVAEASKELSRQGLGVEQTLKRTRDAMILARLGGMEAVAAVESLTAAINTFDNAALNSTRIINKLANVDAAFAVSTEDLAEAIKRVGSSAKDAGLSFDQMLAAVTAAQQKTARGGRVIGNSLKTIFTRVQRPRVIQQFRALGVEVKNAQGQIRPAMGVLQDFAKVYDNLSDSQKAYSAELLGGVFQINVLKAVMSDLGKQFSIYNRALKTSIGSTDQAIQRNEELNKTLSALANETLQNLIKWSSELGKVTFGPSIEKVLKKVNAVIQALTFEGKESLASSIGKGFLGGIGKVIEGPGLVMLTAFIAKLGANFVKFSVKAVSTFAGLNTAAQKQAEIQNTIQNILLRNPAIIDKATQSNHNLLLVERELNGVIVQRAKYLADAERIAVRLAANISASNAAAISAGAAVVPGKSKAGSYGGLIPNFAVTPRDRTAEVMGAARNGYKIKGRDVRQSRVAGLGEVVYNKKEKIKKFPGMEQEAIVPPRGSRAGQRYKEQFQASHGFNPYSSKNMASKGFVPNLKLLKHPASLFAKGRVIPKKTDASGDIIDMLQGSISLRAIPDLVGDKGQKISATHGKIRQQAYRYSAAYDKAMTSGEGIKKGSKLQKIMNFDPDAKARMEGFYKKGFRGKNKRNFVNNMQGAIGEYATFKGIRGLKKNYNNAYIDFKQKGGRGLETRAVKNLKGSSMLAKLAKTKLTSIPSKKYKDNSLSDVINVGAMSVALPKDRIKHMNWQASGGHVPNFNAYSQRLGNTQFSTTRRKDRHISQLGLRDSYRSNQQADIRGIYPGKVKESRNLGFKTTVGGKAVGSVETYGLRNVTSGQFNTALSAAYPNMVSQLGTTLFKKPIPFRGFTRDGGPQVRGRVWEDMLAGMTTGESPKANQRIDFRKQTIRPEFVKHFTPGTQAAMSKGLEARGSFSQLSELASAKGRKKIGFSGGFIPNLSRKVLDTDYLREYSQRKPEQYQGLLNKYGVKNVQELFDHIALRAGQRGQLSTIINAPAGTGKTSLAMGSKGSLIHSLDQLNKGDNLVIVKAAEGKGAMQDKPWYGLQKRYLHLEAGSDEVHRRRELRDRQIKAGTSKTAFGRKAGSTRGAGANFGVMESLAAEEFQGTRGKFRSIRSDSQFKLHTVPSSNIPIPKTKAAAFTMGAFRPFTKGHERLTDEIKRSGLYPWVGVAEGKGRDFLSRGETRKVVQMAAPWANVGYTPFGRGAPDVVRGVNPVTGRDEAIRFDKARSHAVLGGDRESFGKSFEKAGFGQSKIIGRGPSGGKGVENLSGTWVREAIKSGKTNALKNALPDSVYNFVKNNQGSLQKRLWMMDEREKRVNSIESQRVGILKRMGLNKRLDARSPKRKEFPDLSAEHDKLKLRKDQMSGRHGRFMSIIRSRNPLQFSGGHIPNLAFNMGLRGPRFARKTGKIGGGRITAEGVGSQRHMNWSSESIAKEFKLNKMEAGSVLKGLRSLERGEPTLMKGRSITIGSDIAGGRDYRSAGRDAIRSGGSQFTRADSLPGFLAQQGLIKMPKPVGMNFNPNDLAVQLYHGQGPGGRAQFGLISNMGTVRDSMTRGYHHTVGGSRGLQGHKAAIHSANSPSSMLLPEQKAGISPINGLVDLPKGSAEKLAQKLGYIKPGDGLSFGMNFKTAQVMSKGEYGIGRELTKNQIQKILDLARSGVRKRPLRNLVNKKNENKKRERALQKVANNLKGNYGHWGGAYPTDSLEARYLTKLETHYNKSLAGLKHNKEFMSESPGRVTVRASQKFSDENIMGTRRMTANISGGGYEAIASRAPRMNEIDTLYHGNKRIYGGDVQAYSRDLATHMKKVLGKSLEYVGNKEKMELFLRSPRMSPAHLSEGLIPNFAKGSLTSAIEREKGAGYSSGQVKVGYDSRLKASGGLGVYNSSEGSLGHAIGLHRAGGSSMKSIQSAGVPNMADPASPFLKAIQTMPEAELNAITEKLTKSMEALDEAASQHRLEVKAGTTGVAEHRKEIKKIAQATLGAGTELNNLETALKTSETFDPTTEEGQGKRARAQQKVFEKGTWVTSDDARTTRVAVQEAGVKPKLHAGGEIMTGGSRSGPAATLLIDESSGQLKDTKHVKKPLKAAPAAAGGMGGMGMMALMMAPSMIQGMMGQPQGPKTFMDKLAQAGSTGSTAGMMGYFGAEAFKLDPDELARRKAGNIKPKRTAMRNAIGKRPGAIAGGIGLGFGLYSLLTQGEGDGKLRQLQGTMENFREEAQKTGDGLQRVIAAQEKIQSHVRKERKMSPAELFATHQQRDKAMRDLPEAVQKNIAKRISQGATLDDLTSQGGQLIGAAGSKLSAQNYRVAMEMGRQEKEIGQNIKGEGKTAKLTERGQSWTKSLARDMVSSITDAKGRSVAEVYTSISPEGIVDTTALKTLMEPLMTFNDKKINELQAKYDAAKPEDRNAAFEALATAKRGTIKGPEEMAIGLQKIFKNLNAPAVGKGKDGKPLPPNPFAGRVPAELMDAKSESGLGLIGTLREIDEKGGEGTAALEGVANALVDILNPSNFYSTLLNRSNDTIKESLKRQAEWLESTRKLNKEIDDSARRMEHLGNVIKTKLQGQLDISNARRQGGIDQASVFAQPELVANLKAFSDFKGINEQSMAQNRLTQSRAFTGKGGVLEVLGNLAKSRQDMPSAEAVSRNVGVAPQKYIDASDKGTNDLKSIKTLIETFKNDSGATPFGAVNEILESLRKERTAMMTRTGGNKAGEQVEGVFTKQIDDLDTAISGLEQIVETTNNTVQLQNLSAKNQLDLVKQNLRNALEMMNINRVLKEGGGLEANVRGTTLGAARGAMLQMTAAAHGGVGGSAQAEIMGNSALNLAKIFKSMGVGSVPPDLLGQIETAAATNIEKLYSEMGRMIDPLDAQKMAKTQVQAEFKTKPMNVLLEEFLSKEKEGKSAMAEQLGTIATNTANIATDTLNLSSILAFWKGVENPGHIVVKEKGDALKSLKGLEKGVKGPPGQKGIPGMRGLPPLLNHQMSGGPNLGPSLDGFLNMPGVQYDNSRGARSRRLLRGQPSQFVPEYGWERGLPRTPPNLMMERGPSAGDMVTGRMKTNPAYTQWLKDKEATANDPKGQRGMRAAIRGGRRPADNGMSAGDFLKNVWNLTAGSAIVGAQDFAFSSAMILPDLMNLIDSTMNWGVGKAYGTGEGWNDHWDKNQKSRGGAGGWGNYLNPMGWVDSSYTPHSMRRLRDMGAEDWTQDAWGMFRGDAHKGGNVNNVRGQSIWDAGLGGDPRPMEGPGKKAITSPIFTLTSLLGEALSFWKAPAVLATKSASKGFVKGAPKIAGGGGGIKLADKIGDSADAANEMKNKANILTGKKKVPTKAQQEAIDLAKKELAEAEEALTVADEAVKKKIRAGMNAKKANSGKKPGSAGYIRKRARDRVEALKRKLADAEGAVGPATKWQKAKAAGGLTLKGLGTAGLMYDRSFNHNIEEAIRKQRTGEGQAAEIQAGTRPREISNK